MTTTTTFLSQQLNCRAFEEKKLFMSEIKIDIPSNWQHRRSAICIDLTNQMYKEKKAKNDKQKGKRGKTGKEGTEKTATLLTNKKQQTNLRLIVHSLAVVVVVCLPTTIHLFSFNSLN